MPDEISYDSPYKIPIGVLIGYFVLTILHRTLRNAKAFCAEEFEQEDLAFSQKSPASEHVCEGIEGETCILRAVREADTTATSQIGPECGTGWDSATGTNNLTENKGKGASNDPIKNRAEVLQSAHPTANNDELRKGAISSPSQGTGFTTGDVDTRVFSGSQAQKNNGGSQSSEHCRYGEASRGSFGHENNCPNVQSCRREEATQVYLKQKDQGVGPKFTEDQDQSETVIYQLIQAVVQQTQQHMYKQLQQSLQQTYSGLTLGTPVHAKDFTARFLKQPDTIILTKARHIASANVVETSDWDAVDEEEDWNAPDV